jgi:hypothetical protein
MVRHISNNTDTKPADVFKTYPEFSKLTLGDRKKYETLIRGYPPLSDLSFATLMMWWNILDSCAVSILNGNPILSYWLPGDEKVSGLALVGTNEVDRTICAIFDHMRSKGEKPRLVHVPEYVIEHMAYGDLFTIKPERAYDEYILDISKYYPIRGAVSFRRHRVRRFEGRHKPEDLIVKSLNLSDPDSYQMLLDFIERWQGKGVVNNITINSANDTARYAMQEAGLIGVENVCLFVEGELAGYLLYIEPVDKRYVILCHIVIDNDIPYIFDYLVYAFSRWFFDKGVRYVNIDSDLGLPLARMLKVALGPVNYFRKYTIEPANR